MDLKRKLLLFAAIIALTISQQLIAAQHEDIPYENVDKICEKCVCLTAQAADKRTHQMLSCALKNFKHILARWPAEFGKNHTGAEIVATFSGNSIEILQQLPATNAALTFSCRHCDIKHLQAPTFMDVPNIRRLDLAWNLLTSEELTADVFRGPYNATRYEPIALTELILSHNQLRALDSKLFEHMPNLTKLDLSYNNFTVLDKATTTALASVRSLQSLDLSQTNIKSLPDEIFKGLSNLKMLHLAGNQFTTPPANLHLIGRSLETLDLAGNQIARFAEQSLLGLKVLRRLNISDMQPLTEITKGSFSRLETLEYLYCARNPKLELFDLDSLTHCANLTHLDISYCNISTLTLPMDLSNSTQLTRPWPKLRTFETVGNTWFCDCELLQVLEYIGAHHQHKDAETRCDSPYVFAGARLSNLTAERVCALHIPRKYRIINEDPPRFLRKRYIILTLITVAVVLVIGLLIGMLVVYIRRRLKRDDFGIEPIRYTSVRSSNLSAFSHIQPNGNATGHA